MSKVFTIAEGLENLGALRTGGQGSVYKGKRIGAIYSAVKLIPTPIYTEDQNDKNYRNFQNEVAKLHKVNENPNPNVVKILSSGITESGSFPYIEMEYIEGPDLCELLQPPHEKVFLLKELIKVADQLANALAHCHQVSVKHGDVKSNNVKYNVHTGNYVLLDFGLSIMSDEQRRSSIRHAGAIEFMAPEQHEGKMLFQTDVYSYGVILYELLAGQVPFPLNGSGDTGRNEVMLGHLEHEIPDPLKLRESNLSANLPEERKYLEMQVPKWFLDVLNKCLEKNPLNRFTNGMELHEALINGSLSSLDVQSDVKIQTIQERLGSGLKQDDQSYAGTEQEQAAVQALAQKTGLKYNASKDVIEADNNMVFLPRKVWFGVLTAAFLFMALFGYTYFFKSKPIENVTIVTAEPYVPPFIKANNEFYNRMMAAKRDSIKVVRKAQPAVIKPLPEPDSKKQETKKKRKKFLGIF